MSSTMKEGKLFIGGIWRDSRSAGKLTVINPATEETIGYCAMADTKDIDEALVAAHEAWLLWRISNPWDRTKVLRETARLLIEKKSEIALTISQEQGKPIAEAEAEIQGSAEIFDWCADEARRIFGEAIPARSQDLRLWTIQSSVGPVAAFTASNFPALLAARKMASAIAAGCSVILKPAEETPFTAIALVETLMVAGLPAGVINLLTGDPELISQRLIASPIIHKISLTGSVSVGQKLLKLAADRIIPSTMELGGHAACIVTEKANLKEAAKAVVKGKWRNNGQVCIAMSRLIVQESIEKEFTDYLLAELDELKVGPATDPSSTVGPLLNKRTLDRALSLTKNAIDNGGKILSGGQVDSNFSNGYFFTPTIVSDPGDDADIWQMEPFAPVLPMKTYKTLDEAIIFANSVPYGLAGYGFTTDLREAMRISAELDVGMVGINNLVIATAEAPAGGVKISGFGREGGPNPLNDYLVSKYINVRI